MIATRSELDAFHEFAVSRVSHGGVDSSLEDLLAEWRNRDVQTDVHAALKRAIAEMHAGEGEELEAAMESLRTEFGIAGE